VPQFNSGQLSVRFLVDPLAASSATLRRRYTLTHNDLTGALHLSVGCDYNAEQVAGWRVPARLVAERRTDSPLAQLRRYTRLLRDEVLAEWSEGSLHVHVHVRGERDWWLAPSRLRAFIFRREMPLVLDTLRFADRDYLRHHSALMDARVLVHFHDCGAVAVEDIGRLGGASGAVSPQRHEDALWERRSQEEQQPRGAASASSVFGSRRRAAVPAFATRPADEVPVGRWTAVRERVLK
jgi:hypothetical protein